MENDNNIKCFAVIVKCGHVGKNNFIPISLPIKAYSKKEASSKARWYGRVKHHNKQAILDCRQITEEEYNELIEKNNKDPYLQSHSSTEQKRLCGTDLKDRIVAEPQTEEKHNKKDSRKYRKGREKERKESWSKFYSGKYRI